MRAGRAWVFGLVVVSAGALGQTMAGGQRVEPGLREIMQRLEANFAEYLQTVPNLFCDERVESTFGGYAGRGATPAATHSESIFRLQRRVEKSTARLSESRQVVKVDGKRVAKEELSGPSLLYGVFATATGLFSPVQERCASFRLRDQGLHLGPRRIVIEYETLPKEGRDPACGTRESRGRAWVDPVTMRIRKIEVKTSNYEINKEFKGDWVWVAEYDPVLLGGREFWLPKVIRSDAVSYGTNQFQWTFMADYRNYHKMTASGRIVPGTVAEPVGDSDAVKPKG